MIDVDDSSTLTPSDLRDIVARNHMKAFDHNTEFNSIVRHAMQAPSASDSVLVLLHHLADLCEQRQAERERIMHRLKHDPVGTFFVPKGSL